MNTSELSPRERQMERPKYSTEMVRATFDTSSIKPITPEEHQARLQALKTPDDSEIDFSDIPQLSDERLEHAVVIRNPWMQPPTKTTLKKVRIDSDIIFWIIRQVGEEGYQEKMNAMLRQAMEFERGKHG